MNDQQRAAIHHYEAALKAAFPEGATCEVFNHWNEARKALAQPQGEHPPSRHCECAKCVEYFGDSVCESSFHPETWKPQDHIRDATKKVQGKWVDLTPQEVTDQIREGAADGGWQGFAQRIIAKFKSKNTQPVVPQGEPIGWTAARNLVDDGYGHSFTVISSEPASLNEPYFPVYTTPPVVPQGEPVACNYQELERLAEEAECVRLSLDKANIPTADSEGAIYSLWGRVCRFAERTTPPSVEAAIEATKERAAKVLDQMAEEAEADSEPSGYVQYYREKAAAIRSMK